MRYTVVCGPQAQAELARIWLQASDRHAVTRAADEIDRILRFRPETAGESQGDHRRLAHDCLVVEYRVSPDDALVEILTYQAV